jgi:hypothetical protein
MKKIQLLFIFPVILIFVSCNDSKKEDTTTADTSFVKTNAFQDSVTPLQIEQQKAGDSIQMTKKIVDAIDKAITVCVTALEKAKEAYDTNTDVSKKQVLNTCRSQLALCRNELKAKRNNFAAAALVNQVNKFQPIIMNLIAQGEKLDAIKSTIEQLVSILKVVDTLIMAASGTGIIKGPAAVVENLPAGT